MFIYNCDAGTTLSYCQHKYWIMKWAQFISTHSFERLLSLLLIWQRCREWVFHCFNMHSGPYAACINAPFVPDSTQTPTVLALNWQRGVTRLGFTVLTPIEAGRHVGVFVGYSGHQLPNVVKGRSSRPSSATLLCISVMCGLLQVSRQTPTRQNTWRKCCFSTSISCLAFSSPLLGQTPKEAFLWAETSEWENWPPTVCLFD